MLLSYVIRVVGLSLCQCPMGCNFIVDWFYITHIHLHHFLGGDGVGWGWGGKHVFYSSGSIGRGRLRRVFFVDSVLYFYPCIPWTLSS